ncbi:MAG: hypothetical protein FD180_711 [Planctomycetota bacterium]|nr:MAG: hypothetical protein FD180_711 [Planctomycetota bacterium]
MKPDLFSPTRAERRIAEVLRTQAVAEMTRRIGDIQALAITLGLHPTGVKSLMAQRSWEFDVAFRVAETLGLPVVHKIETAAL